MRTSGYRQALARPNLPTNTSCIALPCLGTVDLLLLLMQFCFDMWCLSCQNLQRLAVDRPWPLSTLYKGLTLLLG